MFSFNPVIIEILENGKIIIFVADSLGKTGSFNLIKSWFEDTPFSEKNNNNTWIFLEGMRQHAGSNDCGIFTLIIYTKYLKIYPKLTPNVLMNLKNISYNTSAYSFGIIGRTDIANCLIEKK